MKQAIERLRQESNEAICKGEAIRALTLAQVADALQHQLEHDWQDRYRREANIYPNTSGLSGSARALEAIDPVLTRRPR